MNLISCDWQMKTLCLNTYLEIFNLQLRIIIEQLRGYQLEVIVH